MSVTQERNKLTGIRDLDYMILNRLSDKDLLAVCQVNKEVNKLCNDDKYWQQRIKYIFDVESNNLIELKNFLEIDTWREMYNFLSDRFILERNKRAKYDEEFLEDPQEYYKHTRIISDEYVLPIELANFIAKSYQVIKYTDFIHETLDNINAKEFPEWINKRLFMRQYKFLLMQEPSSLKGNAKDVKNKLSAQFNYFSNAIKRIGKNI